MLIRCPGPDCAKILYGTDCIDEITIRALPQVMQQQLVVVRKIRQVQERLTSFQQLPAWLQFAKARQGSE